MPKTKTLVAYYSRAGQNYVSGAIEDLPQGNASVLAGFAAAATGGDLFEIETVKRYPADYYACTDEAQAEKRANARLELSAHVEGMDAYDTVVLIYPNWWGTMPMVFFTLLGKYPLAGKTIVPFTTHGGSGFGDSLRDLKRLCPKAKILQGLEVRGTAAHSSEDRVSSWLKKLGFVL